MPHKATAAAFMLALASLPGLASGQARQADTATQRRLAQPVRVMPSTLGSISRPNGHFTFATVVDGDTIPLINIHEVNIYSGGMLLTQKEIRQNQKLIRNVRLMLPYAQEGKRRLDALEIEIAALPKKQRKQAIKRAEKQLMDDYKDDLTKKTFSQGLVLIKLIDRETNRTAYNIVGELRGSLSAGLYQTLAKLFGLNLKSGFDPEHDKKDDLIDRICISIERGQL
ncbi:MAG: DUF4294 domain-containing protein [Bacteroidales bacterium]|nr:DUF4294 domain-containing protein [Bacteroidales bacterium]